MRLFRAWKLVALLRLSHWCQDRAEEIFDQIDEEKRLKALQRSVF